MPVNPCRAARSHFSDHLDGERLPLLGRLLVRLHLAVCPPCQRFHRSLAATRDALRALRDADVAIDHDRDPTNRSPGV
jgi:predicted anti-sigma-YlaC factor YlaD